MKLNKNFLVMLLLVFSCRSITVSAQTAWTIYDAGNSGLPDNNVRCLAIRGHEKWVGTDDGLVLFNDTTWTVYDTSNSAIPDNYVRTLTVAPDGAIWVGTFTAGMARFDGSTWQVWDQSNSGLPNNFVRAIAFDTAGIAWIGTSSGLAKFDGATWQVWNDQNSALLSNNISAIAIGSGNVKYLATINGGMYDFNDTTFTVYTIAKTGLPDNSATRIALDSLDNRWYSSPAAGLMIHYEFNYWAWYNTVNSGIGSNALTWITIDSLQNKYMASMQRGIIRLDAWGTWTIYDTVSSPIPDVYTQCVEKENNNIVWIGTQSAGLVKMDESPSGIDERANETQLVIYPNPVSAGRMLAFSRDLSDATVGLYDISGRLVFTQTGPGTTMQLPQTLLPGMYVMTVTENGKVDTVKLVVR